MKVVVLCLLAAVASTAFGEFPARLNVGDFVINFPLRRP